MSGEHRSEALRGKVRVYCSQWASCGWKGYRNPESQGKCPRCGKEVVK